MPPVKRIGLLATLVLAAVSSLFFASGLWFWVLDFDPGFVFAHQAIPTGPPLSKGVTILLVDGLRLDASRGMPTLNELRVRGAAIDATVGTPSFSRPGRATLAVGAPPAIHGVTTNRQKRSVPLDNLIRRVGASGGKCRIAGSKIWSGLFGEDIARCGVYREGEAKEGPGKFVQQVPAVRAAEALGIRFALEEKAMLRIADIVATDFAAHEYGGTSPEYLAEVRRVDTMIAEVASRLDLSSETLVITADHGHRDLGGHGGEEAAVLAIPIVMVGAGIRSAVTVSAAQADLAPTLGALLGLGLPTASSGRPIEAVLQADDAKLAMVKGSSAMQKQAFEQALAARLDVAMPSSKDAGWTDLMSAHRARAGRARIPTAALLVVLVAGLTALAIRVARPDSWSLVAGVIVGLVTLLLPLRSGIPVMSFSAINYDEMLIPFFVKVMTLAAVTTLAAIAAALFVGRVYPKRAAADSPVEESGAMGLLAAAILAMPLIVSWWRNVLLSPFTLPGPDSMVVAFALTLSILSASLTSLAVAAAWTALERARRGSQTPPTP
jgi:hypothetical protein